MWAWTWRVHENSTRPSRGPLGEAYDHTEGVYGWTKIKIMNYILRKSKINTPVYIISSLGQKLFFGLVLLGLLNALT